MPVRSQRRDMAQPSNIEPRACSAPVRIMASWKDRGRIVSGAESVKATAWKPRFRRFSAANTALPPITETTYSAPTTAAISTHSCRCAAGRAGMPLDAGDMSAARSRHVAAGAQEDRTSCWRYGTFCGAAGWRRRALGRRGRLPAAHGAGQARRPLHRDARRHSDRQGRLGHRHRRQPVHRGRERRDHRPAARVHQRPGHQRLARHHQSAASRCRRAIAATITSDKKTDEIRMTLGRRRREGLQLDPPQRPPIPSACR